MKTAVVYYSNKGSNEFLAKKAAEKLGADLIPLKPRVRGLVLPATATKISFGNSGIKEEIASFDRIILCGPLYMGSLAAPCVDFIRKYGGRVKTIDLITCCGSVDEKKDDTFGYGRVFEKLKEKLGSKAGVFEAFPIALLLPEAERENDEAMMNTRMNEENFSGAASERLDGFVEKIISHSK